MASWAAKVGTSLMTRPRKSRPKLLHDEHIEVTETPTGGVGLTASFSLFTDPKIVEPVRDEDLPPPPA